MFKINTKLVQSNIPSVSKSKSKWSRLSDVAPCFQANPVSFGESLISAALYIPMYFMLTYISTSRSVSVCVCVSVSVAVYLHLWQRRVVDIINCLLALHSAWGAELEMNFRRLWLGIWRAPRRDLLSVTFHYTQ